MFAEFGLPKKIVSDAGTNFISDKFKQLCRHQNIEQAIILSCHHQSRGPMEVCIKFMKHTIKNALVIMMTIDEINTSRHRDATSSNSFI